MDFPEEPPLDPTMGSLAGVPVPGFAIACPGPLAAVFSVQATITAAELCRLLPIDEQTLRRHCKVGNISYVQLGFGVVSPRRGFTLEDVMRFLEGQRRTQGQPSSAQARRRTFAPPSPQPEGFKALHARLIAERKAAAAGESEVRKKAPRP